MPEVFSQKPAWGKWTEGAHPALADLSISSEELERAQRINERVQAELLEARGAIGGGLGADLEFINQQERLVASFSVQLAHWEDESLQVETRSWSCKCGAQGDEWSALEPFTMDVNTDDGYRYNDAENPPETLRIESKHGDPACPECGSTALTWTSTDVRSERVHAARQGLTTALYRLSRFDEALAVIPGTAGLLDERIHELRHAVYKPDNQRCKHVGDYQEYDRLYSAIHAKVLPALRCPQCGDVNVTPLIDIFQPSQAILRAG